MSKNVPHRTRKRIQSQLTQVATLSLSTVHREALRLRSEHFQAWIQISRLFTKEQLDFKSKETNSEISEEIVSRIYSLNKPTHRLLERSGHVSRAQKCTWMVTHPRTHFIWFGSLDPISSVISKVQLPNTSLRLYARPEILSVSVRMTRNTLGSQRTRNKWNRKLSRITDWFLRGSASWSRNCTRLPSQRSMVNSKKMIRKPGMSWLKGLRRECILSSKLILSRHTECQLLCHPPHRLPLSSRSNTQKHWICQQKEKISSWGLVS